MLFGINAIQKADIALYAYEKGRQKYWKLKDEKYWAFRRKMMNVPGGGSQALSIGPLVGVTHKKKNDVFPFWLPKEQPRRAV